MVVNKKLTRQEFIKRCGADSGYSSILFGHLYDCIFVEAMAVEDLYENFYKAEYDSYSEFLLKRYGMTFFMHNQFISLLNSNPDLHVIDFSALDHGDAGISDFLFSDQLRDRVYNILLMKEDED